MNTTAYSDLVIVALVLHVLIELLLWVELNPGRLQILPYLQHKPDSVVDKLERLFINSPIHIWIAYILWPVGDAETSKYKQH